MPEERSELLARIVQGLLARGESLGDAEAALAALLRGRSSPSLLELAEGLAAESDPELVALRGRFEGRLLALAREAHDFATRGRPWSDEQLAELGPWSDVVPESGPPDLDELESGLKVFELGTEEGYRRFLARTELDAVPWAHLPREALLARPELAGLSWPEAAGSEAVGSEGPASEGLVPGGAPPGGTVSGSPGSRRTGSTPGAGGAEGADPNLRAALQEVLRRGTAGATAREVLDARDARDARLRARGEALLERHGDSLARVVADLLRGPHPEPGQHPLAPDTSEVPEAPDPSEDVEGPATAAEAAAEATSAAEPDASVDDAPARSEARERDRPAPAAGLPHSVHSPPSVQPEAAPAPAPAGPPRPSIWREHLQPFLLENWYLAVGALMVVVGSSLLAYFTWDRHWAVRYTVLPALLAAFTATLGGLGGWLERKDPQLVVPATLLRGAAVALLPLNLLTVARMAADPGVQHRVVLVPLVAAVYLLAIGRGLRGVCAGVHPGLRAVLAWPLLGLCALVLLHPLVRLAGGAPDSGVTRGVLVAGFYLGFAGVAAAVRGFSRRVLDEAVARDRRVPWFFGATLGLTFVQVFCWVHLSLGQLPRVSTYAPLVVLAGAGVLFLERRAARLAGRGEAWAAESFLGYAVLLLGLFMSLPDAGMRVVGFVLAGAVWLAQPGARQQPLHAWIGWTLLTLGGAAASLLPGFPGEWRGWYAVGLTLPLGLGATVARRRGADLLAETARRLQGVVVVLGVGVGVLVQWHHASVPDPPVGARPLWTAALLVLGAALLLVRAHRSRRPTWTLVAAVVLALALPYLGFVDLEGRTWRGNTVVFGLGLLSLLWIAVDRVRPTSQTRAARSAVLWFYGALGVAAMTLRVFLERDSPHPVLDHTGPFLLAASLGVAAAWSRSLVPAGMAAVILVILFPELQSHYHVELERLGWGTGLPGALSALALIALCGWLRRRPALRDLGPGDRFLDVADFPLRRTDWTLFTWPILASAAYTLARISTVVLAQHLSFDPARDASLAQVLGGVGWVAFAAYGHRRAASRYGVWLGLAQAFVGTVLLCDPRGPFARPFLAYGLGLVLAATVVRRVGPAWVGPCLTDRAWALLRRGALVLAPACMLGLQLRPVPWETHGLAALVGATLLLAGRRGGRPEYGATLFVLLGAVGLFLTHPVHGLEPPRLAGQAVLVAAALALGVSAVGALLPKGPYARWRPVLRPMQVASLVVVAGGAFLAGLLVRDPSHLLRGELSLLALAALALARAHRSGFLLLLAAGLAHGVVVGPVAEPADLAVPLELAGLALGLAVAWTVGARLPRRGVEGRDPLRFDPLPALGWLAAGVAGLGLLTIAAQLGLGRWRDATEPLAAPFLAAAALALVLRAVVRPGARPDVRPWARPLGHGLVVLLTVGQVQLVRVLGADAWEAWGIHPIQQVGCGVLGTLLLGQVARRWRPGRAVLDPACAVLAALVLALLAAHYVGHPDLARMTWPRLAVSALLAQGAALTFRSLARGADDPPAVPVALAERAYHLGQTVALWGALLLVPQLRDADTALVALCVPFFWFLLRAELVRGRDPGIEVGYVDSAAILGHLLLGLYVARGLFQVILFPGEVVPVEHYHVNAWAPVLVGLGLMRLRAHGGVPWGATTGGLALMLGSYFGLTAFDALSPFEAPVSAAWTLLVLAHFWTLASHRRSPLRTALQRLAGLDDAGWDARRGVWGWALVVVAHAAPWMALSDGHPRAVAPLLLGCASVLGHHAWLRRSGRLLAAAGVEVLVALHLDLVVPSALDRHHVVWVLLGLWAAGLVLDAVRRQPLRPCLEVAHTLALLVLVHVLFLGPETPAGWWAFALGLPLLGLTPRARSTWTATTPQVAEPDLTDALALRFVDAWVPLLGLAPAWLAYFGAVERPLAPDPWAVGLAAAALLATGAAALACAVHRPRLPEPARPRLVHVVLDLARTHGVALARVGLYAALGLALAQLGLHLDRAYVARELVLLLAVLAGAVHGLALDGRARHAMLPYALLNLTVGAAVVAVRQQLALTTDWWRLEYDVWVACGASLVLAGAKQLWDLRPREVRVPMSVGLFLLPVAALAWSVHRPELGVNEQLLILGLHSLVYAFLGKDDRESPYHLVAVAGFVGFVLLVFWAELELRSVQAYVVPVALGLLVLAQLFRARLHRALLAQVRLACLLAMLGSSAYEALADPRYPIAFHLSLLGLGLLGLVLGGLLRVRLFLWTGTAGIGVALASVTYRGLAGLERAARMSAIGVLVLLLGAALVGGALYVRTHRERVSGWLERARGRSGGWE